METTDGKVATEGATSTASMSEDAGQRSGGWSTAGKQKARKAERENGSRSMPKKSPQKGAQTARKMAAGKSGRELIGKGQRRGQVKVATGGKDAGDGRVVFAQLRKYLASEAPAQYVGELVLRLAAMAKERRYRGFVRLLPAEQRKDTPETDLREKWSDAIPFRLREQNEGLFSVWDMEEEEHRSRLSLLMKQWVIRDEATQGTIEDRLRFFQFNHAAVPSRESTGEGPSSYLSAVRQEGATQRQRLSEEQVRLRDLCLRPVVPTTQLRQRTEDENRAVVMILNHELEVPKVPPFLSHSMTAGELAVFEDIFMALEYPLYAHLAAGQRFYANLSKTAILAQITAGHEAAHAHKQKIADFKAELSRISLDMKTRLLKVTFKGRATATKWAGWELPLASRTLVLTDYEQIRERAKLTHELVRMDFYSFQVEVRKGAMSSRDMYCLLTDGLGLKIQAMEHTVLPAAGIQERQWQVRVHATACPEMICSKSYVVWGHNEVVIHHSSINVNWPCRSCFSPDHPTRFCAVSGDELVEHQQTFTCTVTDERAGKGGDGCSVGTTTSTPKTMAQLEATLRKAQGLSSTAPQKSKPKSGSGKVSMGSPTRRGKGKANLKLSLPEAWGQSRQPHQPKVSATESSPPEADAVQRDPHTRAVMESTSTEPRDAAQEEGCPGANEYQAEEGANEASTAQPDHEEGEDDQEMESVEEEKRPPPMAYADAVRIAKLHKRQNSSRSSSPVRGRAPAKRAPRASGPSSPSQATSLTRSAKFLEKMQVRAEIKTEERQGARQATGRPQGEAKADRRASHSPKRKVSPNWLAGRAVDTEVEAGRPTEVDSKARSLSPKRRTTSASKLGPKIAMQSFMHQFMTAITGKTDDEVSQTAEELAQEAQWQRGDFSSSEGAAQPPTTTSPTAGKDWNDEAEQRGFALISVSAPSDEGAALAEWLDILNGTVVDVAANGHCGWLAYYAALYNRAEGLDKPAKGVVTYANLLKKRVLNEMLANLMEEAQLHPEELRAEAAACGCPRGTGMHDSERLCAVANHLVDQRGKTVKASVQMHYWVRPMHLKAMAIHAREMLYVLDVQENGQARLQAYGYHDIKDADGDLVETGTVCPVPTVQAKALLKGLVAEGVRPPVMILRWSPAGNHFQAVNYKEEEHANYANNIVALSAARNRILVEHGWKAMDTIAYDPVKTAKAAAAAVLHMRQQVHSVGVNLEGSPADVGGTRDMGTEQRKEASDPQVQVGPPAAEEDRHVDSEAARLQTADESAHQPRIEEDRSASEMRAGSGHQ